MYVGTMASVCYVHVRTTLSKQALRATLILTIFKDLYMYVRKDLADG